MPRTGTLPVARQSRRQRAGVKVESPVAVPIGLARAAAEGWASAAFPRLGNRVNGDWGRYRRREAEAGEHHLVEHILKIDRTAVASCRPPQPAAADCQPDAGIAAGPAAGRPLSSPHFMPGSAGQNQRHPEFAVPPPVAAERRIRGGVPGTIDPRHKMPGLEKTRNENGV